MFKNISVTVEAALSVDRSVDRSSKERAVAVWSTENNREWDFTVRQVSVDRSVGRQGPIDRETCTHARTHLPETRSTRSVDRTDLT